jgi:hypothetical protein
VLESAVESRWTRKSCSSENQKGWGGNACQPCVLSGRTEGGRQRDSIRTLTRITAERQCGRWLDAGNSNPHQGVHVEK